MTTLERALNLHSRGLSVIPVPLRTKRPVITGWQNKRYSSEQLRLVFSRPVNIGVLLGDPSDGLIDIDLDHARAVELAASYLPHTDAVFGRAGKPRSHWLYRVDHAPETQKFQANGFGMIVELRSTGAQTIFPGSFHPSGEPVEWDSDGKPATVDSNALRQAVKSLADAVKAELLEVEPAAASPAGRGAETPRETPWLGKALAQARIGSRNDTGFWLACQLRDNRIARAEAEGVMRQYAQCVPQDPGHLYTAEAALSSLAQAYGHRPPRKPATQARSRLPVSPGDWPAPMPIPDALPPVKPFDAALLPESLRPWIMDIAERMQCPPAFPAIGAMVALASVVGRRIGIRPKQKDDWLVVPNLWGAIIGRPSTMKSPPLKEAMKPLKRLIARANDAYAQAMEENEGMAIEAKLRKSALESQIKAAMKAREDHSKLSAELLALKSRPAPTRKRYLTNDTTVEALGELLADNPAGLIVTRDELIGLLKYLEREGQESARAFYLEGWAGDGSHETDRIGRGNVAIEAVCISIIGTIQPGPLGQYLRGAVEGGFADDGLVQRFQLAVWPDDPGEWRNVDRWPNARARDAAYGVFEGLDVLDPGGIGAENDRFDPRGVPFLRFDSPAQGRFDEWMHTRENQLRQGDEHPAVEAHLTKYRSLIPSLALLIHLAEEKRGPVGLEAVGRAIGWGDYLEPHARRIYSQAIDPAIGSAKALANRITAGDVQDGFALRDLYRKHWSRLATKSDAADAVNYLTDLDWLLEITQSTPGRSKIIYRINPKVGAGKTQEPSGPRSAKRDKSPSAPPSGAFGTASPPGDDGFSAAGNGANQSCQATPAAGAPDNARSTRQDGLSPDRPGPTDLLSPEQYARYRAVYKAHEGTPNEKHAAAWRAALAEGGAQ